MCNLLTFNPFDALQGLYPSKLLEAKKGKRNNARFEIKRAWAGYVVGQDKVNIVWVGEVKEDRR